jgi:hypothetical protein
MQRQVRADAFDANCGGQESPPTKAALLLRLILLWPLALLPMGRDFVFARHPLKDFLSLRQG